MMIATLLITFTIFLVLGVPIAFAMGLSGVIALFAASDISLLVLPQLIDWTIGRKAPPLTGAVPGHNAEPRAAFEKRARSPISLVLIFLRRGARARLRKCLQLLRSSARQMTRRSSNAC